MSGEGGGAVPNRRGRRGVIVGIAVGVVVVAALLVWAAFGALGGAPGPSASPGASASVSSSPGPDAASADPDPSDEPSGGSDGPSVRPTDPPASLDGNVEPAEGLIVTLAGIEPFDAESSVPGEVSGPALKVTVHAENTGDEEVFTTAAIANLYYGPDRTPANILVDPRTDFPQSVKPGESAEGVYAFSVPADQRDEIVIELDFSVDMPIVLFEGALS